MKIDLLCEQQFGSTHGVTEKTIWGDDGRIGVGGSELALLTLCSEWQKAGHEICLYNNPREPNGSSFEQRAVNAYKPRDPRDVLIVVRSPNPRAVETKNCLKVWWSCDQYTRGSFKDFRKEVDKLVGISPMHREYFRQVYQIDDMIVIDIPIRLDDYLNKDIERIPNRLLFSSVPARGLDNVYRMWSMILKRCPDAHLVITSDYRLWGVGASNQHFRTKWQDKENYTFLGAVTRDKLIEEQLRADVLFYPSNYEELFCLSVAESLVAGSYPITSGTGSLPTTNMGTVIGVDSDNAQNDITFINVLTGFLNDREVLERHRLEAQIKAMYRFNPKNIIDQWEKEVFA